MKFKQSNISTKLYVSETNNTFVYFIPGDGGPDGNLSFEDSWYKYDGYYIFLNGTVSSANKNKFISQLLKSHHQIQDERLVLWLTWKNDKLTTVAQIAFKTNQWNNYGDITSVSNFGISNYTMSVDSSMMLYPSDGTGLLERSEFNNATIFSFLHAESKYIQPGTVKVQFGAGGSIPGAITGIGLISDFSDSKASGWDVGFRYFMNDGDNIVSQQYPVFNNAGGTYIEFHMQWDMFNPLAGEKTFLKFTGRIFTLKKTGGKDKWQVDLSNKQSIPTFFRTRLGHALELTPNLTNTDKGSKLVFQEKVSDSGSKEYYLTPSGEFTIGIHGATSADTFDLLCGLTGTEYIGFAPGDYILFKPNNNAMAANFPASSIASQGASLDCLSNKYKTAWIQILPGKKISPQYYSQPESSPLYKKDFPSGSSGSEKPINIFAYQTHLEKAILNLGTSEGMNNPASDQLVYNNNPYPMVPYAGIDSTYTIPYLNAVKHTLADLESQAIAPTRKEKLAITSFNSPSNNNVVTITPQGFLITLDKDTGEWIDVVLAKNQVKQLTSQHGTSTTDYTLEFVNLTPQLINAFQCNQQFLVISTKQNIGKLVTKEDTPPASGPYFKNEMSIEGWPFIFDFAKENKAVQGNYSNIMIFKYCKGTLKDLVKAPQNWIEGDKFNSTQKGNSLQGLSAWLTNYIAEGIQAYKNGDEDFEQFYEIVTDPNWNGILGLNVDIDVDNFPPQLEGLLAGIDESKFRAHHFGVQVNQPQVSAANGDLQLGKQSSLFGLINYTSPPLVNGDDPQSNFDFRVLLLKVVFQHSKITNFKGKIQLLVNKLFGSEVIRTMNGSQQSSTNDLIFNSGFEVHDGYPVYTFTDLNDTRFYMNNNVLDYVEISKASFFTILPKNRANNSNDIKSRFSMWGYMGFDAQTYGTNKSRDLFSFGDDQNNESLRKGLSFSNFWVNMDFNLNTPTDVSYSVELSHMDFDKALSNARTGSLVKKLPMSMSKIITGNNSNTMGQQGFVPMELIVEGPNWELPKDKWYGLVFDLNLGTLGDLVGKSSFTAELLIAWGTESRPGFYPVAVGIALPGVNSKGDLFNLEGLLKVTMDGIKLIGAENTNTNSYSYMIQISDIALKFLGIKLPPGATTEFLIFGDPKGHSNKIGWYGAYINQ